jgi:hypothetical protein
MANARKRTIPYDINYIEKYLMEGPMKSSKTYYVSYFIESIKVNGTTDEKIKYAKKYINDKTYNFSLFSRNPENILRDLNLLTNEIEDKEKDEKIRKLGIFLTPDDNLYFSQFFTENKVLPISNPELQYPAKKHQFIENLWIINSKPLKPSFDGYYSSLYRMIRCYRLEQQIEERIPGIMKFMNDEDEFIHNLKLAMCNYVDNEENKIFIETLLSNIRSVNLKNNTNLRNITNIDNFRTSFRFKNSNSPKAYASEIEINVCCKLLEGIINNNIDYVLNKTTNPSQYTSNNNMTNYNYTGTSQTNPSQSQTPDNNYLRIGNTSNNLFELAINKSLPFFYRNDTNEKGICQDWLGLVTQQKIDEYNLEYQKSIMKRETGLLVLGGESSNEEENNNSTNEKGDQDQAMEKILERRLRAEKMIQNPSQYVNPDLNPVEVTGGYHKKQSRKQFRKQSRKKLNKKK